MNDKLFTEQQIIDDMRERQRQLSGRKNGYGGIKPLANEIGFDYRHIAKVISGNASLSESIVDAMGYERVVMYKKREK